jgi:hypothetical protein
VLEKQALCRGLKFSVPRKPSQVEVDSQFESLFRQLPFDHSNPSSEVVKLKSDLVSVSKSFSNVRVPPSVLSSSHISALRSLKKKDSIVITRPDKGNGVVILDSKDYINKVSQVLSDNSKFHVDDKQVDSTMKLQKDVVKQVDSLVRQGIISKAQSKGLKPIGSHIPKLYGLPKIHKPNVPVRPILSMCNSPTYDLAKWLCDVLFPVRDALGSFTLKDSFSFVEVLSDHNLSESVMASLDVSSLFTNVPLRETISIIKTVVQDKKLDVKCPVDLLESLLLLCTENVQFFFNDKLYTQTDGVAMGSPLGPILADIFLGYLEHYVLRDCIRDSTLSYFRFVDDVFATFRSSVDAYAFLDKLNSVHKSLHFSIELEKNGHLPFLDIMVSRDQSGKPLTQIYRKPTWSGLYTHFYSFVPLSYKKSLVRTLFHRARKLCSSVFLHDEFVFLTNTLLANGYPRPFILTYSQPLPQHLPTYGPEPKSVFIKLPFLGESFSRVVLRRVSAVKRVFPSVKPVVLFATCPVPVRPVKACVPRFDQSHLIYKFTCDCGDSYVGRTERTLLDRASEHIPQWLSNSSSRPRSSVLPTSSITRHAMSCNRFQYCRDFSHFTVLFRSSNSSRLKILEALSILYLKPPLSLSKDFVLSLLLPWH